jgi:hypothetical protein
MMPTLNAAGLGMNAFVFCDAEIVADKNGTEVGINRQENRTRE